MRLGRCSEIKVPLLGPFTGPAVNPSHPSLFPSLSCRSVSSGILMHAAIKPFAEEEGERQSVLRTVGPGPGANSTRSLSLCRVHLLVLTENPFRIEGPRLVDGFRRRVLEKGRGHGEILSKTSMINSEHN